MIRSLFSFIFFGLVFYGIWLYFPDTFAVLVTWVAKLFAMLLELGVHLVKKINDVLK